MTESDSPGNTKICGGCFKEFPDSEFFGGVINGEDIYHLRCKTCRNIEYSGSWESISTQQANRIKLIQLMGGKCSCCGIDIWWVLEFDHKIPIRTSDREPISSVIKRLLRYPYQREEWQLLCSGCNISKGDRDKCNLPHWFVPPTIITPKIAEIF